jgi:RNA polymerase sporulation-specific sigma factor
MTLLGLIAFGYVELPVLCSVSRPAGFKQPLSEAAERACLQDVARGDVDAYQRLVEHNLRLVAFIAKKFRDTGVDEDDLISLGSIGLMKAVKNYRLDAGTKFATYAARCIENEILMHLRTRKKQSRDVSMDESIGKDKDGNDLTLRDVLGTDADDLEREVGDRIEQERLRDHLHVLDPRERTIVALRYGLQDGVEWTQYQIAQELGISRSYVSRIEARALTKLQHSLRPRPRGPFRYGMRPLDDR